MTCDELSSLKDKLILLADGIDPQTGYKVDDTILNSAFNKSILHDTISFLDQLLNVAMRPSKRNKKLPFFLLDDQKNEIKISDSPITISAFTYAINAVVNKEKMKTIKAVDITTWLVSKGYLKEKEDSGEQYKILTPESSAIGMSEEKRESQSGRTYVVNLYDRSAQRFIIDHLDEISQKDDVK